jgi:hypothetical protein
MDREALQTLGIEALVNCALSCTLTRKPYYPDQWDYLELECVWGEICQDASLETHALPSARHALQVLLLAWPKTPPAPVRTPRGSLAQPRLTFYRPPPFGCAACSAIDTPTYPLLELHFAEFYSFVESCAKRGRKVRRSP